MVDICSGSSKTKFKPTYYYCQASFLAFIVGSDISQLEQQIKQ